MVFKLEPLQKATGGVAASWRRTSATNVGFWAFGLPVVVGLIPWMLSPIWKRLADDHLQSSLIVGLAGPGSDLILRLLAGIFILTHQRLRSSSPLGPVFAALILVGGNIISAVYVMLIAANAFGDADPGVYTSESATTSNPAPAPADEKLEREGSAKDEPEEPAGEKEADAADLGLGKRHVADKAAVDASPETAKGGADDGHMVRKPASEDYVYVQDPGKEDGFMLDRLDRGAVGLFTVAALATRMWNLSTPGFTLFDEVHFGKFVNHHILNTYYFDIHPPFTKFIITAILKLFTTYDGTQPFETIGEKMNEDTPVFLFRLWPCVAGCALVPTVYILARLMKLSQSASFLSGTMVLLDLLFIGESRMILTDSSLFLFFTTTIVFLVLQERSPLHSAQWYKYTALIGLSIVMCTGTKWTGLSAVGLVGVSTIVDMAVRTTYRPRPINEAKDTAVRLTLLLGIPAMVYMCMYYAFFQQLYKEGPGSAFMLPNFQASLEGHAKEGKFDNPTFWASFSYLNREMFRANKDVATPHDYQSYWYTWPQMDRPINCWQSPVTRSDAKEILRSRVYLFGNPAVWWTSSAALVVCPILVIAVWALGRRAKGDKAAAVSRGSYDAPLQVSTPTRMLQLYGGLSLSVLPYALVQRACFLYHYMPAYIFAILITGMGYDQLGDLLHLLLGASARKTTKGFMVCVLGGLVCLFVAGYWYWAPIVYGTPLTTKQYNARLWNPRWR